MRYDVLTIFPEFFEVLSKHSIIGRAVESGIITINAVNIRDFSKNKHHNTDDYTYGGGSGMIMNIQPIMDAYLSISQDCKNKPKLIYLSPQGKVFNHKIAEDLSKEKHIVLLCGHYEGIDERIIDSIVDEEISIGDYVLSGGELPAMVFIDCVSRLIPGVLGDENSSKDESHTNGLLEYPQYTRPAEYMGMKVPEILLSGHHANIQRWRIKQSIIRTIKKRPELIEKMCLSDEYKNILEEVLNEKDL